MRVNKQRMMLKYSYLITSFAAVLLLSSCGKIQKLPPEPSISFRSFEVFDTTDILGNLTKAGRLKFYFEDGDGDLGIWQQYNGSSSDTVNLFMTLFRKQGNIVVPAPDDDLLKPTGYRIPYIEKSGQNKILQGVISVTLFYYFYSPSDTILYEFYIKDRAGNLSNTERTCEIIPGKTGICTNK